MNATWRYFPCNPILNLCTSKERKAKESYLFFFYIVRCELVPQALNLLWDWKLRIPDLASEVPEGSIYQVQKGLVLTAEQ